ncbi:MAG: prolipoprotein diacylglyceryl transferase [Gemmatimonadota bacterium]
MAGWASPAASSAASSRCTCTRIAGSCASLSGPTSARRGWPWPRWGNFFNQELYGPPTNLPWKIYIDPLHRLPRFANDAYYQPLFLYESLWDLGNMAFLLWLARRHGELLRRGDVFLVYMIVYAVGRFLLEFLRVNASRIEGINFNQSVMVGVAMGAAVALAWRHRAAVRTGSVRR